MSTQFIKLLPPPGPCVLSLFTPSPAPNIPAPFIEALSIRTAVFVDEQKCAQENEIDADDPRSYHWVVYASVSGPKLTTTPPTFPAVPSTEGGQLPVATIRLVPPPHNGHPFPRSVDGVGGTRPAGNGESGDWRTSMHDGKEPFVKLGRLATLKKYRGLGLGRLLVNTAVEWAAKNKGAIREGKGAVQVEREKSVVAEWNGLVLVHAQRDVEKFYRSLGFVTDEGLGEWVEEGIQHVGMWRRLEVGS